MTSAYPDIEGQLYTTGAPDGTYTEAEARQRAADRREVEAAASAAGASALADAKAYTDARAGEVSREATAYTDHRVSAVDVRIRAVETMAGLAPGEVTDAQTANLITQPDTSTRAALNSAMASAINTDGSAPAIVYSGDDPFTPRPDTGRAVIWVGTSIPANRLPGDMYFSATAEPPAWSPAMLDLIGWHDASGLAAGVVTQIDDKGARALHLSQKRGTGDVSVTEGVLAHPAFEFDMLTAFESVNYPAGLWQAPVTVYIVARPRTLPAAAVLFDGTFGNVARVWFSSGGRVAVTGPTTLVQADGGTIASGTTYLVRAHFDNGASSEIGVNGSVLATGDVGIPAPIRHRLGSNSSNASFFDGWIGEAIVALDVTPEQDTQVQSYLQEKWGIV